ncbi:MAG: hypothetical protein CVT60_04715 [Actinobacteria bacterium HGW-Actinobacteria-10]|jgi:hypothetical protein|nr:MAG: hypothetical protein CVT60_04715 [Actinobacteria bacterium HGW-Actinobacteria-10]
MGLFNSMFGSKHPDLDSKSDAASQIARQGHALEAFVSSANDRMEAIPGDGPLYVFVGRPPKAFGLVWFDGDGRHDVRSMVESKAMTRDAASQLAQELPVIYSRYSEEGRFAHKIGSTSIVVTPSAAFYAELQQAVTQAQA